MNGLHSDSKDIIELLIYALPTISDRHSHTSEMYSLLDLVSKKEVANRFSDTSEYKKLFHPFGDIVFPYTKMGNIDSVDLFGLDELIIFSFYYKNRFNYHNVLDLGTNLGLHSFVMERCGFTVQSFEPDPWHFNLLERTINNNGLTHVKPINAAVSTKNGEQEFIRVLGNTTGSHLAGAKSNVYGEINKFKVRTVAFEELIGWADLIKIDVEGYEANIIKSTSLDNWASTDAIIEVGNENNAKLIFEYFEGSKINLFAQKLNWERVKEIGGMPTSYRDGSLFISINNHMRW